MTDHFDDQLRVARQCLRRLILPIPFGNEENAVRAILEASAAAGVTVEDLPDFIELRVRQWETGDFGDPDSSDFVAVSFFSGSDAN